MAKNNNYRDKEKPRKKPRLDLADETKKGIIAILVFVFALISILSVFSGNNLPHNFLYYFYQFGVLIFGSAGYFLLPLASILVGVAMLMSIHKDIYGTPFIGIGIFLIALLGIFQLVLTGRLGVEGNGGGYIGFGVVWPMLKAIGVYATYIILLALVLISILITFNISLIGLINKLLGKKEKEEMPAEAQLSKKEESALGSMIKKVLPAPSFKVRSIEEEEKIKKESGKKPEFELILASKMTLKDYKLPPLDLLEADSGEPTSGDIKANANIIKRTLQHFGIEVEMAEVNIGPTVTQYTLRPAQGIRLSKITALQNDLSLSLAAHPIRIEAPIPGRSLVGIEIPNKAVTKVRLRNLLEQPEFNQDHKMLNIALGRDVAGTPVFASLEKMPHFLIAGATGTGKTICLNTLILSLLYRHAPNFLKLILIDPKRVEFPIYNGLPHLLTPVIVDAQTTINALRWAVNEMEKRFEILSDVQARDIIAYNKKFIDGDLEEPLPYIIIIVDELADLMASHGRDVEATVVRLAQMARAVGIHLVLATQRPSVEVITGLIKANITSRVAFQVASQIDSRTILDSGGAEKLLGNGDMLFLSGDASKPKRIQGTFISEKEIKRVSEFLSKQAKAEFTEEIAQAKSGQTGLFGGEGEFDDDFYEDAKKLVVESRKASASLLQRRLRVGYARAARLLDILEDKGVIGPGDGAKPREVYLSPESGREHFENQDETF
ncbi:MAG: cell division protein FtsK [Candidatus Portnoybacteria bacterium CG_4_8_14_3_um_filter_40_10]|uniref:Cell division protein FtsK n=2 Tax=Candidatus Portnoyibacteriota TaxID=1817913 RepID=A0A2M7IIF0_9BACT|nr:MAG: cell division protein FtsK [Candidatus Portnoybacteria bacterium CG11_big_fil_rev_8_21_14_0_20_40_15]PIW76303.1 MAG: cell division protein FtsK [Candidatus Portnoybacteria bacterium CG_4_8_14_3_um_filter_40_10]